MTAERPGGSGTVPGRARDRRGPGPAAGAGALGLAVIAGLVALGGTAPPAPDPVTDDRAGVVTGGVPPIPDPGAVARLRRAEEASRELAWQGTEFVARWSGRGSSSAVVDVVHVPGRGSLVRPASPEGGAAAPTAGVPAALVPEVAGRATAAPLGLLQRHYVLRGAGEGRCAGRVADVVEAWPRHVPAGSPAARFWLDRETGLVLRREVHDAAGRLVLATAFLDLQVPSAEPPAGPAAEPPAGPAAEPAAEPALHPVDPEALRDEGWPVPPALAGLELHGTRIGGSGPDRVVHLAYSDGLLGVSVFAQPGELDPAALQGWERRRVGTAEVWVADSVPQRVAWTAGGSVFTVLADAPGGTLDEAVRGLPHDDPGALEAGASRLRERLARGLGRVAGWASPTAA